MFKPDIPTIIIRHKDMTYQQKTFLLWCWTRRSSDSRYDLLSCRQDCALEGRTIQWYADFIGVKRSNFSVMLTDLKKLRIAKIECKGTRNECLYIDFTVFC
jgi:hypothetical protein